MKHLWSVKAIFEYDVHETNSEWQILTAKRKFAEAAKKAEKLIEKINKSGDYGSRLELSSVSYESGIDA